MLDYEGSSHEYCEMLCDEDPYYAGLNVVSSGRSLAVFAQGLGLLLSTRNGGAAENVVPSPLPRFDELSTSSMNSFEALLSWPRFLKQATHLIKVSSPPFLNEGSTAG